MNFHLNLNSIVNQVVGGLILAAVLLVLGLSKKQSFGIVNATVIIVKAVLRTHWRILLLALEIVGMWVGIKFFVHGVAEPHVADTLFVFQALAAAALALISWIGFGITFAFYRYGR